MGIDVLVLAAGMGTRLGELTRECAKPALMVGRQPAICHVLEHLFKFPEIGKVRINLHYKPRTVRRAVSDRFDQEMSRIEFDYEEELLGVQGSIFKMAVDGFSKYSFLVVNGDTLADVNYSRMLQDGGYDQPWPANVTAVVDLATRPTVAVTAVTPLGERSPSKYGIFQQKGTQLEFREKPLSASFPSFINIGSALVTYDTAIDPTITHYAERTEQLHRHHGYYFDIGTPEEYARACAFEAFQ